MKFFGHLWTFIEIWGHILKYLDVIGIIVLDARGQALNWDNLCFFWKMYQTNHIPSEELIECLIRLFVAIRKKSLFEKKTNWKKIKMIQGDTAHITSLRSTARTVLVLMCSI